MQDYSPFILVRKGKFIIVVFMYIGYSNFLVIFMYYIKAIFITVSLT